MKLTNNQIYNYALQTSQFNLGESKVPIKIGFFLQKNIQVLAAVAEEIEKARLNIAKQFGELSQEGDRYVVQSEKIALAEAELNDLFNLEQDLNIHVFKLEDFSNIELTYQQLASIMFMIEE